MAPERSSIIEPFDKSNFIMPILKFQESLEICTCHKLLTNGVLPSVNHVIRMAMRSALLFIVSKALL
jgi:hypothetical protein